MYLLFEAGKFAREYSYIQDLLRHNVQIIDGPYVGDHSIYLLAVYNDVFLSIVFLEYISDMEMGVFCLDENGVIFSYFPDRQMDVLDLEGTPWSFTRFKKMLLDLIKFAEENCVIIKAHTHVTLANKVKKEFKEEMPKGLTPLRRQDYI
jgi:hypothetical protein